MNKNALRLIGSTIDLILSIIGFWLFDTPFVKLEFGSLQRKITAFDFLSDVFRENQQFFIGTDHEFGELWIYMTFIMALAFLIFNLISVIISALIYSNKIKLKHKNAVNDKKQNNPKTTAILYIVVSIIWGVVMMILELSTLKMTGYDSEPLARLGEGAIASGIIYLLTAISISLFAYFIDCFEGVQKQNYKVNKQEYNGNWISDLKNIKELYDAGVLSDEEYKEEKNKIMNTRKKLDDEEVVKIEPQQVAIIAKRKLTGKYVSGDVSIII